MITHILKKTDWTKAKRKSTYLPKNFKADGFIHCSAVSQLVGTANSYYYRQKGLVVLCIDESKLTSELRWDQPSSLHDDRATEKFPHLYGPLNTNAVVKVVDFPPQPDGSFELPEGLAQ
jgi:uncharacterized protein (DUF952 family)